MEIKLKESGLELERLVGIEGYLTSAEGIGGRLKQVPEDFVVEEITPEGGVLEVSPMPDGGAEQAQQQDEDKPLKEYAHFTFQKTNWDTMRAVKEIARRLRVSGKRLGYAGTKDKRSVSTQRVSVWNTPISALKRISIKDILLKDFCYSDLRINLGDLWGNKFTITIRGISLSGEDIKNRVNGVSEEIASRGGVPNYYGLQRFGVTRPITHLVGKKLLEKKFQEAVMVYLADDYGRESPEASEARKFLSETLDYREALKKYPKYLGYECAMLNHLAQTPTDYAGALRKLPKKLRWMFIHAYQGFIFNKALSAYLKSGNVPEKLPLVGLKVSPDEVSARLLESEGLSQSDFEVKPMPELSSDGEYRDCFMRVDGLEFRGVEADELNEGFLKVGLRFRLQKGSYATMVLREFIKNDCW